MSVSLVSAAERPDLVQPAEAMTSALWPAYLSTAASKTYWADLYSPALLPFQTIAIDADGIPVAMGNAIPFAWNQAAPLPDTGWDAVLEAGALAARAGTPVNALSALAIAIRPDRRGTGLAERLLGAMKATALAHGLNAMLAPVRPTLKASYPLQDFATYIAWRRPDGSLFDPWLRSHERLGARILSIAWHSMTCTGSVEQWQDWTKLRFPAPGAYAIPGALAPLVIDHATATGRYVEPNVWMRHVL